MKDIDENLQYLKDRLLQEETPPKPQEQAEPLVYRNFANNYGADIRNFANGYQGSQTPKPAPEQKEKPLWSWVLADSALLAAIIGVLIWWAVMAGVIG